MNRPREGPNRPQLGPADVTEIEGLLLSAAIEAPVTWLVAWRLRLGGRGPGHVALASAVATAVTHPQFWAAALLAYPRFGYWPSVAALEALVVLVEAVLIAWMAELPVPAALAVSLIANAASCAVGLALR